MVLVVGIPKCKARAWKIDIINSDQCVDTALAANRANVIFDQQDLFILWNPPSGITISSFKQIGFFFLSFTYIEMILFNYLKNTNPRIFVLLLVFFFSYCFSFQPLNVHTREDRWPQAWDDRLCLSNSIKANRKKFIWRCSVCRFLTPRSFIESQYIYYLFV